MTRQREKVGTPATALALSAAWLVLATSVAAQAPAIKPVKGLNITTADFYGLIGTDVNYDLLDMENHLIVQDVRPDGMTYDLHLGAPTNGAADEKISRYEIVQMERRVDLDSAMRLSLSWSTDDQRVPPGQTFGQISTAALRTLETSGQLPLVIGTNAMDKTLGSSAGARGSSSKPSDPKAEGAGALAPRNLSGAFTMLGMQRRYYRGTLHRVESGTVPFPVLLNGVRTNLPAVHAAGDFTFGSEPIVRFEFWWLADPAYPLTLKWAAAHRYSVVIRIDTPPSAREDATMASELAGKSCRLELHGVYFATGSAEIMKESAPMLQSVAALIKGHPDWQLTIEGHTDSIGSAAYNQDLSARRAQAVRQTLVAQYGVPAAKLAAKGYGFSRPVESNATVGGRAHNRRVELSRPCGTGGRI